MKRLVLTSIIATMLIALGCFPFGSTITQTGRIVPRVESPIYISSAGRLVELYCEPGAIVDKGDKIARLENAETELEALKLRGRVATQQGVVESLRHSQLDTPEAGNQLPTAEAMLEDLKDQLRSRESRVEGLTVTAPASGRLIESPKQPIKRDEELTLASWSGRPTDSANLECYLETGTELMAVTSTDQWDVEVSLESADVQRIQADSGVRMVLNSLPNHLIRGSVVDIARSEWTLDQNFERRDSPETARSTQPLVPKYVVRIQLESTRLPLVTGATTTVRIDADSISVFGRLWRILTTLIRFR